MKNMIILFCLTLSSFCMAQKNKPTTVTHYYPGQTWQKKSPAEVGLDAAQLQAAVDFAIAGLRNERQITAAIRKEGVKIFAVLFFCAGLINQRACHTTGFAT